MVLSEEIRSQPLLLVGCGGIGCEVIKDLLLMGFNNIKMIDLDTIDVSNLNRQFLFNKTHINQSKAMVSAKVSSNLFANGRNDLNLIPIHGSILSSDYDVEFFKSFSLVINALDNRQARSHVNRMCLAADVPLIESGTEGYLGQTFLIKKNVTACYECSGPVTDQKTFASCTIRNTPSLPIHCIVWAKHLFNQLFGEDEDPDNDVSPDMNDPELMNSSNDKENSDNNNENSSKAPSTRKWAENNNYDAVLLFDKLFRLDIEYLHKMDKLWKNRTKPITLKYDQLDIVLPNTSSAVTESEALSNDQNYSLQDQKMLSLKECYDLFVNSLDQLKQRLKLEQFLVWDKDDEAALDFVTAVSNLRSFCFHIERKSKFDVKSMAGNIIPAISSTNSIIGGLMVLQLINLSKQLSKLSEEQKANKKEISELFKSTVKHVFLRRVNVNVSNLIAAYDCFEQNPKCLVCCTKNQPEIEVKLNLNQVTMCEFVEQFIFKKLHFVCPDIQLDGQPTIIWSKDDYEDYSADEKEEYKSKLLSNYSLIKDKVRLKVYDLLQSMTVIITLINEEFSLNENDGLFYKMKITSEADEETTTTGEEASTSSTKLNENETSVSCSIDNEIVEQQNNSHQLTEQDSIELVESETNGGLKATNGTKLNNGNSNDDSIEIDSNDQLIEETTTETMNTISKTTSSNNEIVLIDSDEDISLEQTTNNQSISSKQVENTVCEVLDDDDDLQFIEIREVKEKRKSENDNIDSRPISKKPRVD